MTQDDRVGKYWIWKEQLKVAIIKYCCLMCPNVGRYTNYVSKISLQVSCHCSASDMFGPTQLRKKKSLAYWAVDVRPAHPGKDIWQNAWQQTNSGEFSWVKLTLHWLKFDHCCSPVSGVSISRFPGCLVALIIWWVRFQFFYSRGIHDTYLDPASSNSQSFRHKAHNLDKVG